VIEPTRRRLVLPGRSTQAPSLIYPRMTLLAAGVVLAVNQLVLAAGDHLFAASCVAAVSLVVLVTVAAAYERRAHGRDLVAGQALGALALVAAVPVAAAALPLRHISEATGTIIVALLVGGASIYFASRHEIELRLFAPADASAGATKVVAAVATVAFGFCAYLLKAPTINTHGVRATVLGLAALTAAAVGEELLFRGVVQASLVQSFGAAGVLFASLLSAALFTTVGWWLIPVVCAALSFGLLVAVGGALGPAILAHVGFLLGATLVWPHLLERWHPAHPISVAVVLSAGFLVVIAAVALIERRGNV
jgi:membrane protease YdiL (CAAX protease family)